MKTWGGPERKTYYTPDGRTVYKIPSMVEYSIRNEDGTMKTGTRDRNYDSGLLETPPSTLKMHCPNCDNWHDTDDEIAECGKSREQAVEAGNKLVADKQKKEDDRLAALEEKAEHTDEMLEKILKLLEAK